MMTNNLIFLVGLHGSGKTTLAKQFYPDYFLIDDPISAPVINPNIKTIIADCYLCYPNTFNQALTLYPDSFFIFFENNLQQCFKNIVKRNDGRFIPPEFMYHLSEKYAIILNEQCKSYQHKIVKVYGSQ